MLANVESAKFEQIKNLLGDQLLAQRGLDIT